MTKGLSTARGSRWHAKAVAMAAVGSSSLSVDVLKHQTIGVRRWKNNVQRSRKELANIAMSARPLSHELIPRILAESWMSVRPSKARKLFVAFQESFQRCATGCPVTTAVSCCGHEASPEYRFGHTGGRAGRNSRCRRACNYQGDTVARFSASERTNRYRASSSCTRGVSRQTRM